MKLLGAEFIKSSVSPEQFPADRLPEIAFVGRSNVGKSSLINSLLHRKKLAKVSKTPGKTRAINFFTVRTSDQHLPLLSLVDLPGYGYAKVPGRERAGWQGMIEGYLLEREALEMVLVLVDGEIGPTKLDLQMLDWLRASGVPHMIVATKLDKVKPSKLATRKRDLSKACELDPGDVMWVSASKGTGIEQLQRHVEMLLST